MMISTKEEELWKWRNPLMTSLQYALLWIP